MNKILTVIGLMSGTSLDGIDAAIIKTDGEEIFEIGEFVTLNYTDEFRSKLKLLIKDQKDIWIIEKELTELHAKTVDLILEKSNMTHEQIDLIGFHGQTIFHDPERGITKQIGNGALLSKLTKIDVVCDFRSKDVACGGEGAPLLPIYHKILLKDVKKPVAVVNIGGVSNISWIGEDDELIAFDTGPGGALIDDYVSQYLSVPYDDSGNIAEGGEINHEILNMLLSDDYFKAKPPKSLDRNHFDIEAILDNSDTNENKIATLTAFTAYSIAESVKHLPVKPQKWFITGGGRKNIYMMYLLSSILETKVDLIDEIACGDAVEAQGFALLAARIYYKLPISFPKTTGVYHPVVGGAFYRA